MLRPMPDQPNADRRTIAAGVLAMLLLSGNFVASRHGLANGLSVADLVLLRTGFAGLVLSGVLWRVGLGGLPLRRAAILTLLAGAPYFLLCAAAVHFAPATHASILNPGGTMLFAPLLGWWVLRQAPEIGVRVGLFILTAGLLLIGGASLAEGGSQAWIGDLMLIFSGLIWALYGVLMRHWQVPGARAAAVVGTASLLWVPVHSRCLRPGRAGRPSAGGGRSRPPTRALSPAGWPCCSIAVRWRCSARRGARCCRRWSRRSASSGPGCCWGRR